MSGYLLDTDVISELAGGRFGCSVDVGDVLIAGTARAHDLAVATRNVTDFEHLDVEVSNPWTSP